tara:strand:- start:1623 stop:1817 length:195 start_codon:yes stop_codon:yes gene_type:complete
MVNIKNISPIGGGLLVEGTVVEFGDILDVSKEIAEYLISTPNFQKATLDDAKKSKSLTTKKNKD